MTIASEIVKNSKDALEAMIAADSIKAGDQNWEEETTTWNFEDGSVLIVNNSDFYAN